MPVLIRKIEASIVDNFVTEVKTLNLSGEIGLEDYIKLSSFEAFLQNFSNTQETYTYETPIEFGLLRNKKEIFIELQISY